MREVNVVPHNPGWRDAFETEAKLVAAARADEVAVTVTKAFRAANLGL